MRLRFDDCEFDSDTREVFRGGRRIHVSPKAFSLLAALIERRPKAISKDDLLGLIWPGTFVSEANLPNLVADLRESLGDDSHEPRIIRTVPKFGYAFSAGIATESPGPDALAFRLIWGDREITLHRGENVIGRDDGAILWIDDNSVSRRHARIVVDGEEAVLEDLGSKNGTYVASTAVTAPRRLDDGDQIRLGSVVVTFRMATSSVATETAS